MKRIFSLIVLSLLVTPACNRKEVKNEGADQGKDHLVAISPHPVPLLNEFETAFQNYYQKKFSRGVAIEWLDIGGTSDILKFVHSEFARKKEGIDVDLMWGGGIDPHLSLKASGYLQSYRPPDEILNAIPPKVAGISVYDPDLMWFGSTLTTFGFICNKAILNMKKIAPPRIWQDLGNPAFIGAIGSADPRHSGSTYKIYSIILQANGWQEGWSTLMRMGANVRGYTAHSSDAMKEVISGDSTCSLSIDYYARAKIAEFGADKLAFILPEGQSVIDADAISILKGAPHQKAAQEFVSFVLSPEGQRLWLLPVGAPGGPQKTILSRFSILPPLYAELGPSLIVPMNPFELTGTISYNEEEAQKLRDVISDMIGTFVIDIKTDLNRVWQKRIQKGMTPEFLKVLDEIPVSREKAYEDASHWGDPLFRNRVINEWHTYNRWKIEKLERLTE